MTIKTTKKQTIFFIVYFLCFLAPFKGYGTQKSYKEDLSYLRCKFPEIKNQSYSLSQSKKKSIEVSIEYHVTDVLNQILETRKKMKTEIDKAKCYTIQVYLGTNRLLAFSIFEKIHNLFEDVSVQYFDTNYIVRLGKCLDKIELLDKYIQILKIFPNITIRSIFVPMLEIFSNFETASKVVDKSV
jgi:hypothetical protein